MIKSLFKWKIEVQFPVSSFVACNNINKKDGCNQNMFFPWIGIFSLSMRHVMRPVASFPTQSKQVTMTDAPIRLISYKLLYFAINGLFIKVELKL